MSTFSGLQIGLSGLRASQILQDTVGHNVANANTPGYSRQQVHLAALPGWDLASIRPQPGYGVKVADVRRAVSLLLNRQIQRESGGHSFWQTVHAGRAQVQGIFQELGSQGLGDMANAFWSSWHDLSTDPTGNGARLNVRETAETLAGAVRRIHGEANRYAVQLGDQLELQVSRVNSLSDQISALNDQIGQATALGDPANDLRDRRDLLLKDLSGLVSTQAIETEGGKVVVTVGGHTLVGAQSATQLSIERNAAGDKIATWSDDGSRLASREGEIAATLELRDWTRETVLAGLDTFARQIIDSVNAIHRTGYTADNRTGIDFFAGTGAADIRVSDTVAGDLSAIALAAGPDSPGDTTIALEIADLQRNEVASLGETIGGFYATYTAQIAMDVQKADQMNTSAEALVQFLEGRREELAGVSLDEEAVSMLGAQRAYEAAVRVITAVDGMLETMINGMGLVGR